MATLAQIMAGIETRLATIPGVGKRTADNIIGEIGVDMSKFPTAATLASWAGMCPGHHESAGKRHSGKTRRGNPWLRATLVECAWAALRYNAWARATYARLTRGGVTRKKPAIVALARRLLVRLWAMLRDGQPWRPDPLPAMP